MAPGNRAAGFRRRHPRLTVVVNLDPRLVLVFQRVEAAQLQKRRVAVEFPDQRPLVLKHDAGDCRAPHWTNRVVVAPAPALLFELRQQCLVRQRFENQRQAPEVGQLIDIGPRKEYGLFCRHGNLTVLRFFCCRQYYPWRPPSVRFFCPARSFVAGRGVRAAGLGVESAEIAVPAQRIRSFPHPNRGKGNSAPLKAVGVSRRYKQRMRLKSLPTAACPAWSAWRRSLTAPAPRPTLFGWRDACFRPA